MRGLPLAAAFRFVLYTSPDTQQVLYWRAAAGPFANEPAAVPDPHGGHANDPKVLITTENGAKAPTGVCVDQNRGGLYITEPGDQIINRYPLYPDPSTGTLEVGPPLAVVTSVSARWCAVDATGNLFFSSEGANDIYKVPAASLIDLPMQFLEGAGQKASPAAGTYKTTAVPDLAGDPVLGEPGKLYVGENVPTVSGPGGVAVDNFRVFWTNKALGTQVGSVVQGFESPSRASRGETAVIAQNANKVYGVCLSANNLFYTEEKAVHGVKKFGGSIATISTGFHSPRGCAWDGDGTIYVADKGGQAVFSFPANQRALAPEIVEKAFPAMDPVGVAVYETAKDSPFSLAAVAAVFAMLV